MIDLNEPICYYIDPVFAIICLLKTLYGYMNNPFYLSIVRFLHHFDFRGLTINCYKTTASVSHYLTIRIWTRKQLLLKVTYKV